MTYEQDPAVQAARGRIMDMWCGCSTTPEHDWGDCTGEAHNRLTAYGRAVAMAVLTAVKCDQCYVGHDEEDCLPDRLCDRCKMLAELEAK